MAKKSKKTIKWIVIVVVIVVITILGVYSHMQNATPVQIAKAEKTNISAYVEERARTSLPMIYHITMPQDGRIEAITLAEGSKVTKGQVVAQMDVADLDDALKESKDMVTAMVNAVSAASAKTKASTARQDFAQWLADAQEKLYADEKTSELTVKQAQKEHIEAQVDQENDEFVYHAMNALCSASKLMPIYITRRLNRATLNSPIDGVILKRHVKNEIVLTSGAKLLDIGNLDELEVTADILSDDVVAIKAGDKVDIFGPAIGETPIHGTVSKVDPQGFTKISSLGVEQQRVKVTVQFSDKDLSALKAAGKTLGVDYRVKVRIYTATHDDTLVIPRTCLFRGSDGNWEVYAVKNGKAALLIVDVGLMNDTHVEILKGLSEGDQVIVAPESSLTAGTKVKDETTSS